MIISDNLKRAISYVWGQIAPDVSFITDNEEAIEVTFDADKLVSIGENPAAQIELRALFSAYSYREVLAELDKQIGLV